MKILEQFTYYISYSTKNIIYCFIFIEMLAKNTLIMPNKIEKRLTMPNKQIIFKYKKLW